MIHEGVELIVPISKADTELVGIDVEIIGAIRAYCECNNISDRKLAALTGLSSGKLSYHLKGGGDSSLVNLIKIANKIGLKGSITLNLSSQAET